MGVSRSSKLNLGVLLCVAVSLGCGGSSGGGGPDGGPPACIVRGVTVTANPTSVGTGQPSTLTVRLTTANTCVGTLTWTVSPNTGAVTTTGGQASFSSSTPGTYTVTATSTDDPTQSGSTTVTVTAPLACGTANGSIVTHTADVTASETWAGNGTTHQVPGNLRIKAPATVTIEPCAIVQVGSNEIDIQGDTTNHLAAKLVAAGTDDDTGFIVFEPMPSAQSWGFLHAQNEQSFLELDHTVLSQGGAGDAFGAHAPINMTGAGLSVTQPSPVLKADHLVIDHPVGAGIYLASTSGFTSDSTIFGVVGATDYPLEIQMMAAGTIPQYVGQQNTQDAALLIGPSLNVNADLTLNGNIPLYITQSFNVIPPSGSSSLLGVTLTVTAGAELRFKARAPGDLQGIRIVFGGVGDPGANPVGRLIALGTALAPVRFTSAAAAPGAGDWAGLQLLTANGSQLVFTIVEYAGAPGGYVSANCRPTGTSDAAALTIGGTDFVPSGGMIASSIIQFSAGYGIDAVWASGNPNEPDLTGAGNIFTGNAGCKQTYNGVTGGSCPVGGGCTAQ